MKLKDRSVSFLRPGRLVRLACALVLLGLLAGGAWAQVAAPAVSPPMRVDTASSACQGLRIAATGPERLVVGWTVSDGAESGVYIRQRKNLLWEQAVKVAGDCGTQPRDLDLAFDAQGRLFLSWTARCAEAKRCLYYARLGEADQSPQAIPLQPALAAPASAEESAGDADFPTIGTDSQGGQVLVWQESQAMRSTIRAAHIAGDGQIQDLGNVSGASLSGMTPQILSTQPLCVAWYEISEVGSELRVDQWFPAEKRWRPAATERQARQFPAELQVLLGSTPAGLLACWQEVRPEGHSAIKLAFTTPAVENVTPALATQTLAEPAGDHSRPHLSGVLPGRLTLSWQVFAGGQQSVRLASLVSPDRPPEAVTVSAPEQRFAAMPDHVTVGSWSGVVWTDDKRDGGAGGVYFAEATWPANK